MYVSSILSCQHHTEAEYPGTLEKGLSKIAEGDQQTLRGQFVE